MINEKEYSWQITKTEAETPNVISLFLKPTKEAVSFMAGQYLTIKLPDLVPAEGKAYSISSAPHEKEIRITVKKIGSFSTALFKLKAGDTVTTSAPFGYFYPEPYDDTNLVFAVGGIGITPCLSVIKDLSHKKDPRQIYLLYSNQTEADIAFKDEITSLAKQNPNLHPHHFITREEPKNPRFFSGRMTPEKIIELVGDTENTDFFLCGSMDFTKALWKGLCDQEIPQYQIYTEGFF